MSTRRNIRAIQTFCLRMLCCFENIKKLIVMFLFMLVCMLLWHIYTVCSSGKAKIASSMDATTQNTEKDSGKSTVILKSLNTFIATIRNMDNTALARSRSLNTINATSRNMTASSGTVAKLDLFPNLPLRTWKRNMYSELKNRMIHNVANTPPDGFRNILEANDYEAVLWLFDIFVDVCHRNNIPFTLYSGTLIGCYRHHGVIPWDDDIDVLANISHKDILVDLFSDVPGIGVVRANQAILDKQPFGKDSNLSDAHMKVYKIPDNKTLLNSRSSGWPFIDIFFFGENDTHICDICWFSRYCWEKSRFFPVKLRPFEDRLCSVPADVEYALRQEDQPPDECIYSTRNHRNLRRPEALSGVKKVDCSFLKDFHPFVKRTREKGGEKESLIINGTIINTSTFNDNL